MTKNIYMLLCAAVQNNVQSIAKSRMPKTKRKKEMEEDKTKTPKENGWPIPGQLEIYFVNLWKWINEITQEASRFIYVVDVLPDFAKEAD